MGGADVRPRCRFPESRRADDAGKPAGGGRLYDPARPGASDGDEPSLWPGAMGVRLAAARMEPLLLSPRRRGRHRLRPDGERQRCARSICAVGRREMARSQDDGRGCSAVDPPSAVGLADRSEEHTSELQSLKRISYAVFCLKKKKSTHNTN